MSIFIKNQMGRCPQCRGKLIFEKDKEERRWAVCTSCGGRYPLENGLRMVKR